ncbi:hypothetical protein LCGC14_1078050 [marine sediment metagenome]|uniref:Radical SAM core domain-containing protein n=1 Tax=marine sediment metagenome TaxID=412755 RepID=A0A0F9QLY5_9ZZZZ
MKAIPDVIRIEPASACNLRCVYCPTGTGQFKKTGIMTWRIFDLIMRDLESNVPRVAVMYHGGEPLLCKNLWDWVIRLKNLGVKHVKTVTNGTLLDEGVIRKIVASGLDEIEISIDGHSPEESNALRRGSDCQKIMNSIERLLVLKDESLSVFVSNVQLENPDSPSEPKTAQFIMDTFGDAVVYKCSYVINWAGFDKAGFISPQKIQDGYCPHLNETMTIRWNGDVVPCCYDITSKGVLGNVCKDSLVDIWNGQSYERVRRGIREGNPLSFCKGCF